MARKRSETIFTPYNLHASNKTVPTHSKSLLVYIIADLSLKDLKRQRNQSLLHPLKKEITCQIF